jgi:dTDP-L-rhamnose 4-epimerase
VQDKVRPGVTRIVSKRVLITGGAGFVGSHLADELLLHGYQVRALDNLSSQVHGLENKKPEYLSSEVELVAGDIRDACAMRNALEGIDAVFHLAAAVGVGQSMYEIVRYASINTLGTAVLLEALAEKPVERLVMASSMSLYGEGLYHTVSGEIRAGHQRTLEQLRRGEWELTDENGAPLTPVPTPETKEPHIASIYALSKYDQERMCLMIGRAYDVPVVGLRFFNIYGPRQSLSNPYTGVLAIFASRLLNDKAPVIFEDGCQLRDFVSVHDVKRACRLALEQPAVNGGVFNIGSGSCYRVRDIASQMAETLGKESLEPQVMGQYRVGDIRHCFADVSLAREVLGYEPRVSFEEGIAEMASWLEGQAALDRVAEACAELSTRGLTV